MLGTRFPTLRRADLAAPRDSPVKGNSSPEPSPEPGSQRIWLLRPAPEPLLWLKTPSLRCWGKTDFPYNSPNKEDKTHTTTGASKGSPAGGSGAGGGDGKIPDKQGGKGSSKGKGGKANKDQKGNSTGSKDDQKNVKKAETEGGKEAPTDSKGTSDAGTGETSTLVTEVSSLIKTLKTPESSSTAYRHVKTVNLRKIDMGKNERVLIDGGATHVVRKAKSQDEWDQG